MALIGAMNIAKGAAPTGGSGATGMNFRNLDLNLLVVFEAVFSTRSISNAAKQLGMSQPAVSNALARLRDMMRDPLFVRVRGGVDPTTKARRMIGPVREALALIEGQLGGLDFDLASYKRVFKVLMVDALEATMMPPVLRLITDNAPGVSIECVRPVPEAIEDLRTGKIDLALHSHPTNAPDIISMPILPMDTVVIARRGHPGIRKTLDMQTYGSLGHVTLIPEMQVLTQIEKDLGKHAIARRAVYLVNKTWSFAPIVETTDLIALLPRWFAQELARSYNIAIHESPLKHSNMHCHLLWHEKSANDAGHRWLRESMLAAVSEKYATAYDLTPLAKDAVEGQPGRSAPRSRPRRIA
jgi:DNA-binding transcriptional LysR family regulator